MNESIFYKCYFALRDIRTQLSLFHNSVFYRYFCITKILYKFLFSMDNFSLWIALAEQFLSWNIFISFILENYSKYFKISWLKSSRDSMFSAFHLIFCSNQFSLPLYKISKFQNILRLYRNNFWCMQFPCEVFW